MRSTKRKKHPKREELIRKSLNQQGKPQKPKSQMKKEIKSPRRNNQVPGNRKMSKRKILKLKRVKGKAN